MPPGKHSHGLSRKVASGAARGSFGQVRAEVTSATGSRLGKRQAQDLTRRAAAGFEDFYASGQHRPPLGGASGDVLALSCDGKGIVILPGQMRPETARKGRKAVPKQDGRLSRGEVRNRKRMAEAGGTPAQPSHGLSAQQTRRPGPVPVSSQHDLADEGASGTRQCAGPCETCASVA